MRHWRRFVAPVERTNGHFDFAAVPPPWCGRCHVAVGCVRFRCRTTPMAAIERTSYFFPRPLARVYILSEYAYSLRVCACEHDGPLGNGHGNPSFLATESARLRPWHRFQFIWTSFSVPRTPEWRLGRSEYHDECVGHMVMCV